MVNVQNLHMEVHILHNRLSAPNTTWRGAPLEHAGNAITLREVQRNKSLANWKICRGNSPSVPNQTLQPLPLPEAFNQGSQGSWAGRFYPVSFLLALSLFSQPPFWLHAGAQ